MSSNQIVINRSKDLTFEVSDELCDSILGICKPRKSCKLIDCPPGFFIFDGSLCFKSEYKDEIGQIEVYCSSGECFWGGTHDNDARSKLIVQPCVIN
jgi:hypothetical protein